MQGSAEVSGSCLFPLTLQTNAQANKGPGTVLLPVRTQTQTWTHKDLWFLPTPSEVGYSSPDLQVSWLRPSSLEVLEKHPDP